MLITVPKAPSVEAIAVLEPTSAHPIVGLEPPSAKGIVTPSKADSIADIEEKVSN